MRISVQAAVRICATMKPRFNKDVGTMIKKFCDHCGKEITMWDDENSLEADDCFFDYEIKRFIGIDSLLCAKCLEERNKKHIALDLEFLKLQ